MRRLVLFDIDGTLLLSASAGRHAIQAAFAEEFADLAFFDQVRFDGNKRSGHYVTQSMLSPDGRVVG